MSGRWLGGVLALALILAAGCGRDESKEQAAGSAQAWTDVVIGVAGAHSGDLASYGLPSLNAVKLVVAERNARGGVNGRRIEIRAQDDQCKPELATNAATRLLSDNVAAVIGHICSGATKAALPIYKDAGLVCISSSATTPSLTQSGEYPLFFRTIASDDAQARLAVDFVLQELKLSKLAVIHDKGEYGKGFADFAKRFLEQSGKAQVVLFEGITPGAVDYSAVVQKVRAVGADGLVFGGYHPEASKIAAQMRKQGLAIPFVSDDGVKDDTFIRVAGEYAEGVYATGPRDLSANPQYQAAVAAHRKEFGTEPGAFFPQAYAAAQALLSAIEKAGSVDSAKIAAALRSGQFDTPLGRIGFDARGDATGVGFSVYQVRGGRYVELKK